MTSQINPNNIDTQYPVAGQDNSTQGFRTNFSNIKNNFQYAEDEITELQGSVLLKTALAGTSLDNNMNDGLIYAAQIQDFSATRVQVTPVNVGPTLTATLNYSSGHYQTFTTTASTTIAFGSSWPTAGVYGFMRLEINVASVAHTITFPAAVNVNASGIVGLNSSTNVITFPAAGKYTFSFETYQNGASVTVSQTNSVLMPFNNTSEDLDNGSGANTAITTSYVTATGSETATLAAGLEGQTKIFAYYSESAGGNQMVVTVTNAGWKTSGTGTITLTTIGQACTLRYINSKWFCIGNNGCTFA
jgi:hypothetical protein